MADALTGGHDGAGAGELTGNIADLVADAAAAVPRHTALIDTATDRALTWQQVNAAVDAYVDVLAGADLGASLGTADGAADGQPGPRVAIVLPNGSEFCVALFAVLRAGGVAVPVGVQSPATELARVLADSGARLLIGASAGGPDALPDGVTRVPVPDLDPPDTGPTSRSGVAARGGEDLAMLCYTSGTAGLPRGVMLSHRALLANVAQCRRLRPAPVTATDRVLLVVPLFHLYGLGPGLLQVAAAGATAVLMEGFGAERALAACERYRVSAVVGVPAMYQAFAGLAGAGDGGDRLAAALSTVRLLTSGAAPLPRSVFTAIRTATGLTVFEGYGLTETGPVLTSTLASGYAKPGSVGQPLPGVALRLADSDGRPIDGPSGADDAGDADYADEPVTEWMAEAGSSGSDTGRVAASGPNLFSGYWPDGAHGPDADGWLITGDVGYLDADGDLHLVDRANDLIIVNGFNVYPNEVERVLDELAEVAESVVVGAPDDRTGEHVHAVVVLRPGARLSEDAVLAHCTERLARFKVPRVVRFVDSLPYSATGKVRRASVRESIG